MSAPTIGDRLFEVAADGTDGGHTKYKRVSAREVGLRESWFRDSIASNPELVIDPCRRAIPSTDETWLRWATELKVPDVGAIDVLLLSESGRIGIVETKLSYNPEKRRNVVAQVLDYAVNLGTVDLDTLPGIPKDGEGRAIAAPHDVERHLNEGDYLLIIAGDEIDARAVRLSRGLLGDHQVNPWDLALVDLGLFKSVSPDDRTGKFLVVPQLRGVLLSEVRHIVRVVIEGKTPKGKVFVERVPPPRPGREVWDEDRFVKALEGEKLPNGFKALVRDMLELGHTHSSLRHSWGTGKRGSLTLKLNDYGLIELHLSGHVCFRPDKFRPALGDNEAAGRYLAKLKELFPKEMENMPYSKVKANDATSKAGELMQALREALDGPNRAPQ